MTPTKIEITWYPDRLEIATEDAGEVTVREGQTVVVEIAQPSLERLLVASAD